MTGFASAMTDPTAAPAAADELVISAWSAVSPYGLGGARLAAGLRSGRDAISDIDPEQWQVPDSRAGLIPGFNVSELLGGKGTRAMDRATAIVVVTVGMLLSEAGLAATARGGERLGLVVGTGCGSAKSIIDFTRATLTGEKPFYVDPAQFPNTVMNRPAGQSAIWHGLKGPNSTVAGGALTGLLALQYARRLCRTGRCVTALCGAVEEYSSQRAWLEWQARRPQDRRTPVGEGCVMLALEPAGEAARRGRAPLATVLATRFMTFGGVDRLAPVLSRCVAATLAGAGVCAGGIDLVARADPAGPHAEHADRALGEALRGADPTWLECRRLIGDTGAASAAFQLAAVLSAAGAGDRPRLALITSIDLAGTVGCAVLRVAPRPAERAEDQPVHPPETKEDCP